jgi:hypothetical protein
MLVVLREYATLAYWTTLFNAYSLFLKFVYCIAPFSVLEKKVLAIFDEVGVKVTYDKAELGKYDKNKYKVEIWVKDKQFFYRVLDTTLGIGEAYMVRTNQTKRIKGHFTFFSIQMLASHPLIPASRYRLLTCRAK